MHDVALVSGNSKVNQLWKWKLLSRVQLFATVQSMGFSRPEYWSGEPFPSPGDLPNPGVESRSPSLQADSLPSEPPGKPHVSPPFRISRPHGLLQMTEFPVLLLWGQERREVRQRHWRRSERDFPSGLVSETPYPQCRGPELNPWLGN